MNKGYAFVIPAFNPDDKLLEVIKTIQQEKNIKIFIIDDGSCSHAQYVFNELQSYKHTKDVILLKHYINLGKGAALKTAFNHILVNYPEIKGVVTLDSDGQHSIKDSLRVLNELQNNVNSFVLGYRKFSRDIPFKSYIGNNISKLIYRIVLGRTFKDTQTGLRGLSRIFMERCLQIKSNRFEFETEQLVISSEINSDIKIIEIPIETIYIENNSASSFRPIIDSMKVYFILFRYGLSSLITTFVDFVFFSIALSFGCSIFISNMIARNFAIAIQFLLLKNYVFNSISSIKMFTFFYLYVLIMGSISSYIQIGLSDQLNFNVLAAKALTEVCLFFMNFSFLRIYIFSKKKGNKKIGSLS